MQSNLFFVVLWLSGAIYCVSAGDGNQSNNSSESRYISYQDGNVTHVIDLQGQIDPIVLQRASPQDNHYLLFTQRNTDTPQQLYTNNASALSSSNFNPEVPTVVIAHGWMGDQNSGINTAIKQAYLDKSDVNVIVLDWSWVASKNYATATVGVPSAGRSLGTFLNYLNSRTGAKFSDMHIIGFSLGAHLVGNAGRALGTKAARITGLDPAGPLWSLNPARLQKSDAVYVETIHTDRRLLGTSLNVGDADFAPNGGQTQPGCTDDACSHNRSWQYFAATVSFNNLIGHSCGNDIWLSLNLCFGGTLPMGNDDLRKFGSGIFRVKTTSTYPYS